MTQSYGSTVPGGEGTSGSSSGSTTESAKEQAGAVTSDAREAGQHVAAVAKDEARNVTAEAGAQSRRLLEQTRSQLVDQSAQQQQRVASGLRSLGDELGQMARGSQEQGLASDLAQQAAGQISSVASWLENREPGALVDEVKRFARNRPGTFLAAAAGLGLLAGRMSRGLVAEHQEQQQSQPPTGSPTGPVTGTSGPGAVGATGAAGYPSGTGGTAGYPSGGAGTALYPSGTTASPAPGVPGTGSVTTGTGAPAGTGAGYPTAGAAVPATGAATGAAEPYPIDHTTGGGYSAYGSSTDTPRYASTGEAPVTGTDNPATGGTTGGDTEFGAPATGSAEADEVFGSGGADVPLPRVQDEGDESR